MIKFKNDHDARLSIRDHAWRRAKEELVDLVTTFQSPSSCKEEREICYDVRDQIGGFIDDLDKVLHRKDFCQVECKLGTQERPAPQEKATDDKI